MMMTMTTMIKYVRANIDFLDYAATTCVVAALALVLAWLACMGGRPW